MSTHQRITACSRCQRYTAIVVEPDGRRWLYDLAANGYEVSETRHKCGPDGANEELFVSPVGVRVMRPPRSRPTPERCAGLGHPGATFNAREGLTWCLCGAVVTEGDTSVPHVACCDGPLVEVLP